MLDKWILLQLFMYLLATITVCGCTKSKHWKYTLFWAAFFLMMLILHKVFIGVMGGGMEDGLNLGV